ncbi:MAG: glycerol kinase GlpK [Eggerthellaceae bacterium]|nr:glycerol kinase GlpK [Eggerthellaceae bacterium]
MASETYLVALDQGTTSSRAVLVDAHGQVAGIAQRSFEQHFPQPGWVEHDPFDILGSQTGVLSELMAEHSLQPHDIAAIGITNQRETTIVWDARTGLPFGNAIVWQCRRTAPLVEQLCSDPDVARRITETTGLIPDAYFSASKIAWILDNVQGAREAADAGHARFGTVDAWLVYNLTGGAVHATDYTNASRTMLFDIHEGQWDEWLCGMFGVPASMLPEVRPSAGNFGMTAKRVPAAMSQGDGVSQGDGGLARTSLDSRLPATHKFADLPAGIPICGVAGDQQSALFGHCCTEAGSAKNTYGTGCFLLLHTGDQAIRSTNGLVTTIAASAPRGQEREDGAEADGYVSTRPHLDYALEGSVFMAGALIQWLRDKLGLVSTAAETEQIAQSVEDTAGVYVVPAFTGLGAPYWDADARGAIVGLTRGADRAHIVRACLEALAYQTADLVRAMECDAGAPLDSLAVDGGACANDFLMQFQADVLGTPIERPSNAEATAMGAAYLAGLACGYWKSMDQIRALRSIDRRFEPMMDAQEREALLAGWAQAVERVKTK